eukprot:scaffold112505_cov60-Attheya_sp.AAC.2
MTKVSSDGLVHFRFQRESVVGEVWVLSYVPTDPHSINSLAQPPIPLRGTRPGSSASQCEIEHVGPFVDMGGTGRGTEADDFFANYQDVIKNAVLRRGVVASPRGNRGCPCYHPGFVRFMAYQYMQHIFGTIAASGTSCMRLLLPSM